MENKLINRIITRTLFVLLLTSLFSCKGTIVDPPDKREVAIYGSVVDENNTPIQNIEIHYIYFMGWDVIFRNATISYSFQTNQLITFQIFDMHGNEIFRPLNQVEQPGGNHMLIFDGSSYTNGIYYYKITGQTFTNEGAFPLLTDDVNQLLLTSPLTTSDVNGNFEIGYSTLGIGKKFLYQNALEELVVYDSIKFVLHKEGFQDLMFSAKLDTMKIFEKTFKMLSE